MKIEKCGEYKTRLGVKAVVVSTNGQGRQTIIGYIVLPSGTHLMAEWKESGIFFNNGEDSGNDIVGEWVEPKPIEYVPYTWEDREELREKWYRRKDCKMECQVTYLQKLDNGVFVIDIWKADVFLAEFEWLDGTPCGKVKQ